LFLRTATIGKNMKTTTVVVIEMAESMKITVKVVPGSIKFDLSLIGAPV
jgi:hypothetical protein